MANNPFASVERTEHYFPRTGQSRDVWERTIVSFVWGLTTRLTLRNPSDSMNAIFPAPTMQMHFEEMLSLLSGKSRSQNSRPDRRFPLTRISTD